MTTPAGRVGGEPVPAAWVGGEAVPAAWVDGEPVPATEVSAELARLRAGPRAARLPADGTPDGRQLRRWVTQRVVLRRLLDHEAAARGLTPPDADDPRWDPALVGSAAADVLATSPVARAVYRAVTADLAVPEADVRDHYDRNLDRYGHLPYARARTLVEAAVVEHRRQRTFARWLDAQAATRIRLAPGYEHPADPRQPDATHRH